MRNAFYAGSLIMFGALGALSACTGGGGTTPDGSPMGDSSQVTDTNRADTAAMDVARTDTSTTDVQHPQDQVTPTDTTPGPDVVTADTTPATDSGPGLDGTVADSTPGTDGFSGSDGTTVSDSGPGPDAAVGADPCAAGLVVNLNTAGTIDGTGTLNYTGDNSTIPRDGSIPGDVVCTPFVGHEIAYSYTVRTGGHLHITTDGTGTAIDTVVWALDHCAAGGTSLGCDDDDNAGRSSSFTTFSTLSAGTTIFVIVAGYTYLPDPTDDGASGAFQLAITEVPEVATGGTCDTSGATNSCAAGSHCIDPGTCLVDIALGGACDTSGTTASCTRGANCVDNGSGTTTCIQDGAIGGFCRGGNSPCDAGLGCGNTGLCVPSVALGGACDTNLELNVCVMGTSCNATGTCVMLGLAGAECRPDAPTCNDGLACNQNTICVPAVAVGAACDPNLNDSICTAPANCVPSISGSSGLCRMDGTPGGFCANGTDCGTGVTCGPNGICASAVGMGGACDLTGQTTTCSVAGNVCGGSPATCAPAGYTQSALPTPTLTNACTAGTRVIFSSSRDDGAADNTATIPFSFPYFRTPYTQIWPDTNGYAVFGNITPHSIRTGVGNIPTASEGAMAAPWQDDLYVNDSPGSDVCYTTTGASPNRKFILEWFNVSRYGHTPAVSLTFEIVLSETTNTIDFLYGTLSPTTGADAPFADGSAASIGIQDSTSTISSVHTGTVTSNSGIRFTPN